MSEIIHEFLKDDDNKKYALKRLSEVITFKSYRLWDEYEDVNLEIRYYEESSKGFSGFSDKFELLNNNVSSSMHYLVITKNEIKIIGFTEQNFQKALLVFDDIEKEIKRNLNITQLLEE